MITVHLFHSAGEREVVLVPGDDQPARAAARELVEQRVADPASDVYRGGLFDTLSQRYTWDSDATWYRRVAA